MHYSSALGSLPVRVSPVRVSLFLNSASARGEEKKQLHVCVRACEKRARSGGVVEGEP